MKALIIRQPWIDMILSGSKTWEMRSRPTKLRGQIALIEAGTGLVVGVCNLTESRTVPINADGTYTMFHRVEDVQLLKQWPYPWTLNNAQRLHTPIPYNHPKGAVTWVNLEKHVSKAVLQQVT
jgi:hypothetical protein